MDKVVNELYEQIKDFEKDYDDWEETCHKPLRFRRKVFFISLSALFILIAPFVVGVIENKWGNTWRILILLGSIVYSVWVWVTFSEFDKEFKKVPTKFDNICDRTAKKLKEVYGDENVSKFINLLITDLTNKKTTTLKVYDNTIKAVTSIPMLVITTALGFILKSGFDSKFKTTDLKLILGIFILLLIFKIISHGIVSTINNPIWGKSSKEDYLLKILQVVKYEVLKS